MQIADDLLRELADDPSEYERQGGYVVFVRQGRDYELQLKEVPVSGTVIELATNKGETTYVPVAQYVQQVILELPRLGNQIVKTLNRLQEVRPAAYVDGPALFSSVSGQPVHWSKTSDELKKILNEPEPGTTQLIQLVAGAGQGKTMLLEEVARECALEYQPAPYPTPLLLTVDLLGRYVGTVDDAIAGSLNNTYIFPLTQRDVSLCVRARWITLALDGFDELVARIGARDAFVRITELLEQLKGSGSIILSARETFFELYQITAAIRSYLQPNQGTYSTAVLKLLPWTQEQGSKVFSSLGSEKPAADLDSLLDTFGQDRSIVLEPFFLTRLAGLWMKGERFATADRDTDKLSRTKYIIEQFIYRESEEKWVDRDRRPLISEEAHRMLLSGIAEEMWRSGAFKLTAEDLRLAAQLALQPLKLPAGTLEAIEERVPTHAAFTPRDRGYSFKHERFFHYYLGRQIAAHFCKPDIDSLSPLLTARSLSPDVMEWVVWIIKANSVDWDTAINTGLGFTQVRGETILMENIVGILARLLNEHGESHVLDRLVFSGQCFTGSKIQWQNFSACDFWYLDLRATSFEQCKFDECRFSEILVDNATVFNGCKFQDCAFTMIDVEEQTTLFVPKEIENFLTQKGANVLSVKASDGPKVPLVAESVSRCVAKMVRYSERTCDFAADDIAEIYGNEAYAIVKTGLQTNVLREANRGPSGPKKMLVRFKIDRQLLLRGQQDRTGDSSIDSFWAALARKFPRSR